MTFDEWWEDFVAEHDEWKYADSAALRRAAFQAGAASRDAEVEELLAALKDIGDFAHDRSSGPAIEDDLWEVRRMAYELLTK